MIKHQDLSNWIFNIANEYDVKSITLLSAANQTYEIETFNDTTLTVGSKIKVTSSAGAVYDNVNVTSFQTKVNLLYKELHLLIFPQR